jgi:hypothetical protein
MNVTFIDVDVRPTVDPFEAFDIAVILVDLHSIIVDLTRDVKDFVDSRTRFVVPIG